MNLAAFFTYKIKFTDLKLVSFMAYTYNIQGRRDGTSDVTTSADDAGAGVLKFQLKICENISVVRIFKVSNPLRIR